jgi:hypothetical protein
MKELISKIKEALISALPITAIVYIMALTPWFNFTGLEAVSFTVGAVLLILGIGLFNLGADIAMTPMGTQVGSGLSKQRKLGLLLGVSFALGVLITVAEPDLQVLAKQVAGVIDGTALILTVGLGVGLFLIVSILRIVFHKTLSELLSIFYMFLFALALLLVVQGKSWLLPVAFDSGGVTTGPITVPFIMALGLGISHVLGDRRSKENSFGLVALCSIGPILAVMALGLLSGGEFSAYQVSYAPVEDVLGQYLETGLAMMEEVSIALGLIVVFFLICQVTFLRLSLRKLKKIAIGVVFTYVGLVIFLTGVNVGFMPVGYRLGQSMGAAFGENPYWLVGFGVVVGVLVVLAEPAIHVLTHQVEEVTGGIVTRRSMIFGLCVGVGIAIGLSMLRIVLGFSIIYYVVPGYFLSLLLSLFVPKVYTAIAFDSGGVASGPMTSGFILPFAIGVCMSLQGSGAVMEYAFGVVAVVAMTPLITIQLLGFRAIVSQHVRERIAMQKILDADDQQIINFM